MEGLKKGWAWVKRNVIVVLVGIIAVLGAGIFWGYHRGKIRKLEDHLAIKEAHRTVAVLDAKRKALAERADENAEEIRRIQEARLELQIQTVALGESVAGMSDVEVEEAFRSLY